MVVHQFVEALKDEWLIVWQHGLLFTEETIVEEPRLNLE